jgi:hypothetical protein
MCMSMCIQNLASHLSQFQITLASQFPKTISSQLLCFPFALQILTFSVFEYYKKYSVDNSASVLCQSKLSEQNHL